MINLKVKKINYSNVKNVTICLNLLHLKHYDIFIII